MGVIMKFYNIIGTIIVGIFSCAMPLLQAMENNNDDSLEEKEFFQKLLSDELMSDNIVFSEVSNIFSIDNLDYDPHYSESEEVQEEEILSGSVVLPSENKES